MDDTITIFIGLVSLFFYNLARGAILYPIGLYASYLISTTILCGAVACRGMTNKLVPENEIGTIVGAMSVIYASTPAIGSLIYTQTFNLTMDFYLGSAFLVGSWMVSIAIILSIFLNLQYKKYQLKMAEKEAIAS